MTFKDYVIKNCSSVRVINLVLHHNINENTSYTHLVCLRNMGRKSLPTILALQEQYKKINF